MLTLTPTTNPGPSDMRGDTQQYAVAAAAKLVGISPQLLRKWELRYGWPRPVRSSNGRSDRLYTASDIQQIKRIVVFYRAGIPIQELIVDGVPCLPTESPKESNSRSARLQTENAALRRALARDPNRYWTEEARMERERLLDGRGDDDVMLDIKALRQQQESCRAQSIAGIKPAFDALSECGAANYLKSLGIPVDGADIRSVILAWWRVINNRIRENELVHTQDLIHARDLAVRASKLSAELNRQKQANDLLLSREIPALVRRAEAAERKARRTKEELQRLQDRYAHTA